MVLLLGKGICFKILLLYCECKCIFVVVVEVEGWVVEFITRGVRANAKMEGSLEFRLKNY